MKRVILITSSFPYGNGEQFLETEIKYYNSNQNFNFTIIPSIKKDIQRIIPNSINISSIELMPRNWRKKKYYYLLKSLFAKEFYNEFSIERLTNPKKLRIFISSTSLYLSYKSTLDKCLKNEQNTTDIIFYTYWNNEITYALQTLKKKYNYKLVSRVHGGDLYKERKAFKYIPLKAQFTKNIDRIYTITESANKYLEDAYGYSTNTLEVSRLGVQNLAIKTNPSNNNTLHIISCSFLTPIKRVDKVIDSLEILADKYLSTNIKWTHIGSGSLFNQLSEQAKSQLSNKSNITYTFLGNLDNKEVLKFYKNNDIDVFINVSESEGVPVSIMEALSCHIPVIAPDVGGISDLVTDKYNGVLLSKKGTVEEITSSLERISFFKEETTRVHAYQVFLEKYNALSNYSKFLSNLHKL